MAASELGGQRYEADGAIHPVLVLAPHLQYPTRDGADIFVDRLWGELSRFMFPIDILGANEVVRYVGGKIVQRTRYANRPRHKALAALRTVLLLSNYNKEKFVTAAFSQLARSRLHSEKYKMLVFSQLATAAVSEGLRLMPNQQYVISHNDDVKIYLDAKASSKSLAMKIVAELSARWVRHHGRRWSQLRFIHCTEADAAGWSREIGAHNYILGEVGCDIPTNFEDNHEPLTSNRSVRLIFVGSLGVKMNLDALRHFVSHFWPRLQMSLDCGIEVRVVGSNPTRAIVELCRFYNFHLHSNVSDRELDQHLTWADFSILPFEYSSGTKLKLLMSTSRGVPALMTSAVGGGPGSAHPLCLISDDPMQWALHIDQLRRKGISREGRHSLFALSAQWSWQNIAERLFASEFSDALEYPS